MATTPDWQAMFQMPEERALLEAKMADIAKAIGAQYYAGIEARLQELVASGILVQRIRMERHIDDMSRTVIVVDDIPVAEFRITGPAPRSRGEG